MTYFIYVREGGNVFLAVLLIAVYLVSEVLLTLCYPITSTYYCRVVLLLQTGGCPIGKIIMLLCHTYVYCLLWCTLHIS